MAAPCVDIMLLNYWLQKGACRFSKHHPNSAVKDSTRCDPDPLHPLKYGHPKSNFNHPNKNAHDQANEIRASWL